MDKEAVGMERQAITVWKDGRYKFWSAADAAYAQNDPDWLATIPLAQQPAAQAVVPDGHVLVGPGAVIMGRGVFDPRHTKAAAKLSYLLGAPQPSPQQTEQPAEEARGVDAVGLDGLLCEHCGEGHTVLTFESGQFACNCDTCSADCQDFAVERLNALLAAPAAAEAQPDRVKWDKFPAWLIDHHEGDTITEELLQRALADMLKAHPPVAHSRQEQSRPVPDEGRDALPPLPYPDLWRHGAGFHGYTAKPGEGPWFTAAQMRQYSQAAHSRQAQGGALSDARRKRAFDVWLEMERKRRPFGVSIEEQRGFCSGFAAACAILARAAAEPRAEGQRELSDAAIEQGWHQTFSTNNPYCPCNLKSFTKAVRWAERALAAQKKGADRDA
ncbi:hypothetical protein K7G19_07340 [Cupriavidus sp. DB3]|uniref:hypothetical protein n=1 Tax=Cupriavidus sp. DB3 TaxID=2873259 RepID=UPI001CF42D95|nr:hypothetical protein [Cupriavidus sp. DB3]MCA7083412.1 hypothetical protein [Cupriavidus sp. DB3]